MGCERGEEGSRHLLLTPSHSLHGGSPWQRDEVDGDVVARSHERSSFIRTN